VSDSAFSDLEAAGVPAVTMDQMREVDRIMIEDLRIELMQMMENAGRNLARLARRRFSPGRVLIMAGSGGNGGGGMVAARHLANWGVEVAVVLGQDLDRLGPVPAHQLDVLERMGVPIVGEPEPAHLVIDSLIGYSLRGNPRGRIAELIEWTAERDTAVLSLDTPSGLDVTTGVPGVPCVAATATLTLAAPKTGLLEAAVVGELYLADISVPPSVYDAFGMTMPSGVFDNDTVVRLI
jgi:NAD(P)H-hydrate epimerase